VGAGLGYWFFISQEELVRGGGGRVAFYGDCERDIVYAFSVRFLKVGEQRHLRPSF